MRVGSLEIEIMAGIARLQKDMNDAQRIVGSSMANVERSVASAKRAMQALGVGLPLAAITDQVRRMTDQYTKLDAQLRLATNSQAQYAQGMVDVRRISTIAQADINATSMLYTRLMNTMRGTGVEQSKLATVTETVSFGLKAYGATAQEASSAALQLSQAMGANRLGGEEFRAVMEAMPNVMQVVADSMGVPLGGLRQLSIDGKITADVLVKALGDPAIAEKFKAMAEQTQTITGAWTVARNELMLLVGEFMKSSGATGGMIGAFKALTDVFILAARHIEELVSLATIMAALYAGKFVAGLVEARMAQMALNAAHVEALAMNAAMAESALFAARANLAGAAASARAGGSAALASTAMKEYTAATVANAAAQEANAAATLSMWGKLKNFAVSNALGLFGLALWGAYSIADHLGWIDSVFNRADKNMRDLKALAGDNPVFAKAFGFADEEMRKYDARIAQMKAMKELGVSVGQDTTSLQIIAAIDKTIEATQRGFMLNTERDRAIEQLRALRKGFEEPVKDNVISKAFVQVNRDLEFVNKRWEEILGKNLSEAQFAAAIKDMYSDLLPKIEKVKKADDELAKGRIAHSQFLLTMELGRIKDVYQAEQDANQAAADDAIREYMRRGSASAELNAEYVKEQKELADAAKEQWKMIDGFAHDAFNNIFDKGRDTFKEIGNAIKKYVLDMLYKMTVQKWLINIGIAGGGMVAATGGGGDIGSLGSSWLTDFGGSASTSIAVAGSKIFEMGGEAAGSWMINNAATIGQYADVAGQGLGYMTAILAARDGQWGKAIGAAVGTYFGGPIGGMVGGAIGGLFGNKGTAGTNVGAAYTTFSPTGTATAQGAWEGLSPATSQAAVSEFTNNMNMSYLAAAKSLGITSASTIFSLSQNLGADSKAPQFAIRGGVAGEGMPSYFSDWTAQSDAAMTLAQSKAIFTALRESVTDATKYLMPAFALITDITAATQPQIDAAMQYASTLKTLRDTLTDTRTPMERLTQAVANGMSTLGTSAATFKTDFVAAIDAGLTPDQLQGWVTLGTNMESLGTVTTQTASSVAQATADIARAQQQLSNAAFGFETARAQYGGASGVQMAQMNVDKAIRDANTLLSSIGWVFTTVSEAANLSVEQGNILSGSLGDAVKIPEGALQAVTNIVTAGTALNEAIMAQNVAHQQEQQQAAQVMAQNIAHQQEQMAATASGVISTVGGLTAATGVLKSAWSSVTDSIFAEVMRIRGLLGAATLASSATQFALATAKARAGDIEAAKQLPGLSQSYLESAQARATSVIDISRIQSQVASSLAATGAITGGFFAEGGAFTNGIVSRPTSFSTGMMGEAGSEAIMPLTNVNGRLGVSVSGSDKESKDLLRALIAENKDMRKELAAIRQSNYRMWQIEDKWDGEGMPDLRTA